MDNKKRLTIQVVATILQNANFKGFFQGKIYQGNAKSVCVPGLNCYSCPGALGACPVGSLQNALSSYSFKFPYYVLGLLIFFGFLLGRVICGLLCPFGLIQDLLHMIPFPLKIRTFKGDKKLRWVKYAILILLVVVLPLGVKLTPFFCKYLCPSGTLAGILLALSNTSLFSAFGKIFAWKFFVLIMVVFASVVIARPFCKYLCPLGAFYGLFNRFALVRMQLDSEKCISCKKCASVCEMIVDPSLTPNHMECIRCGKCVSECTAGALKLYRGPDLMFQKQK